jgi:metallo-beta-lactamase family protein
VEATYGIRSHDPAEDITEKLAQVINDTKQAGGNLVIPSFAIERSQELLYHINQLLTEDRIPHVMVFVDSPMAVRATEVFTRHHELFDEEMKAFIEKGESPFKFPGLVLVNSVDQSKAINYIKGTSIIIAGSGMVTGGRIKHHLVANISRRESTILFVGYQAGGTLGRNIINGAKRVRLLGQNYKVKAKVVQIGGFSAHADMDELALWLSSLKQPPRHVFVTHGEEDSANGLADYLKEKNGWHASVPEYQQTVLLN